jgi:sugar-specific transcriptional regulator TrmB
MIDSVAQSLGIRGKELRIVQKLQQLGSQPASHVATLCSLPRNTTRSILDALVERGLVNKRLRGRTQFYELESSENIVRSMKVRKLRFSEQLDAQIEAIKRHAEEWDQHKHSKTRPKIRVLEGQAGIERIYEDTLTATSGLKSWADFDSLYEGTKESDFLPAYFKRRAKAGIRMRSIHPMSDLALAAQKQDGEELRESALVPREKFDWKPEIQVYDDKVNITSWREKLGVIIESREITQAVTAIFDLAYEAASAYGHTTTLDPEKAPESPAGPPPDPR